MDKCITNDRRHLVDIASVRPIRIVNRGEHKIMFLRKRIKPSSMSTKIEIFYLALQSSQHHVGGIKTVDKVWWEGRGLLRRIN